MNNKQPFPHPKNHFMPLLIAIVLSLLVTGVFGQTTHHGYSKGPLAMHDWKTIVSVLNAVDTGLAKTDSNPVHTSQPGYIPGVPLSSSSTLPVYIYILPEKVICRQQINVYIPPAGYKPATSAVNKKVNATTTTGEHNGAGTDSLELMLKTPINL
jgi:hypothetical protein